MQPQYFYGKPSRPTQSDSCPTLSGRCSSTLSTRHATLQCTTLLTYTPCAHIATHIHYPPRPAPQLSRAERLVQQYLDACHAHGQHADAGLVTSLQESFYTDMPEPSSCTNTHAASNASHRPTGSLGYEFDGGVSVSVSGGGGGGPGTAVSHATAASGGASFARSQHTLHLLSLTLTSREAAAALLDVLPNCVHVTGE